MSSSSSSSASSTVTPSATPLSLVLHSPFYSTFGQRALFVLEESASSSSSSSSPVSFSVEPVDFFASEPLSPEYLKINPLGKIPTLEIRKSKNNNNNDNDNNNKSYLAESRAIARYLAQQFVPSLYPSDATDPDGLKRAKIEEWVSFENNYLTPLLLVVVDETIFVSVSPERKTNKEKLDNTLTALEKQLDYLERALTGVDYVANNTFSLGDILLTPDLFMLTQTPHASLIDSARRPNVAAWFKRVTDRPAWQRIAAKAGEQMKEHLTKAMQQGKPTLRVGIVNGGPGNLTTRPQAQFLN